MTNLTDKIFFEKKEKIRLIIQQEIGLGKVLEKIKEKFRVGVFEKDGEVIVLVEEKDEEN